MPVQFRAFRPTRQAHPLDKLRQGFNTGFKQGTDAFKRMSRGASSAEKLAETERHNLETEARAIEKQDLEEEKLKVQEFNQGNIDRLKTKQFGLDTDKFTEAKSQFKTTSTETKRAAKAREENAAETNRITKAKNFPIATWQKFESNLQTEIDNPNTTPKRRAQLKIWKQDYRNRIVRDSIGTAKTTTKKTNYGTRINTKLAAKGFDPNDAPAPAIDEADKAVLADEIRISGATGEQRARMTERHNFNAQSNRVLILSNKLDSVIADVRENPTIFGTAGNVSSIIIGMADQVKSFSKLVNPDFNMDDDVDHVMRGLSKYVEGVKDDKYNALVSPFTAGLRKAGIDNRVLHGKMISIAISLASIEAIAGKGRLTSDMVKRKMTEMNATGNSPEAFIKSLLRIRKDLVTRIEMRRAALGGLAPPIPPPPEFTSPTSVTGDNDIAQPDDKPEDEFRIISITPVR